MSSAFANAALISEASDVDAPSAAWSLISSRGLRLPPAPRAPNACLARLRHSSRRDRRIQRGKAAAVSATPIDRSPLVEKTQSKAAGKDAESPEEQLLVLA